MFSRDPLLKPILAAIKVPVLSLCLLAATATTCPSFAQTDLNKRMKELESEKTRLGKLTNPEDRVESLMKIAKIRLTFVSDAIEAKDMPRLASSVDEYRQSLTAARDTMIESGWDAYKKPKGYQAIELATRAHLRILEDFSRRLSLEDRKPVDEVIEAVSKIRDEMVLVLFP